MEKFMNAMQKVLMPIANKLNANRYILALRDGFVLSLPYTMAGSILTAFLSVPFLADIFGEETMAAVQSFMAPG